MYVVTQPTGIFSLILDLIPGLGRGARIRKRLRPTVSKCIMQASRTRRAPRDIPKALSLQSAWVLSTIGFLVSFLFWSLHIPPIGLWQSALWQRWSIIHHQGGWHESEYALWDKFLSATRHKLHSCSFRSIISTNLSATIFAVKHTCQTEWLDSTNKTYVNTAVASSEM